MLFCVKPGNPIKAFPRGEGVPEGGRMRNAGEKLTLRELLQTFCKVDRLLPPAGIFLVPARKIRKNRLGGSDGSTACGRKSDLSEWQRSKFCERKANREFWAPQQEALTVKPIVTSNKLFSVSPASSRPPQDPSRLPSLSGCKSVFTQPKGRKFCEYKQSSSLILKLV